MQNTKLYVLFFIFIIVGIASAQQPQLLDRIVAIVDDEIILDSEVTQMAFMASSQMGINPTREQEKFAQMRKSALENMVTREVLLIQADKDTIEAEEAQVEMQLEQQMAYMVQQVGGEDKVEEAFGMPLSQVRRKYRKDIEKELRVQAVRQQFEMNLTVGRREIKSFYNEMKDSLGTMGETLDLSHILVTAKPGEKARMEAMEKAVRLRKLIIEGQNFEELAKEFSQDPGSAVRGGNLGFMSRDDFVREYAEAAIELEPGETSDVVESEFGFHIIQLLEQRGDKINTRHILIKIEPTEEDEKAAVEKIKKAYQELKDGRDFGDVVEVYSDDQETKNNKGHLGVYDINQIRNGQLSDWMVVLSGLEPGEFSDPVHTPFGYHILKVHSRDSAREYDFDKDYEQISQMALQYKKQKEFNEWVDEIKQEIYIEYK